ncbi:MAG: sulfatase-like hydrolase/transferase, partial [Planctomycetota bacterium]|nr:sulfatase-like hydrolase/transferase [Planctomycetota bacterium]
MRFFFAAAVCFGVLFPTEELAARLPNILLIISDDQSWTDFGFMGHETIRTPSLDRLAAESVVFPRGYVPTSLCRPSLASMVSGLFPHQHKITGNDPPRGTDRREMLRHIRRIPSLPRLLAKKGYLSHQSGKWWEGHYELGGFTHGMTTTGRHGGPGLTIGRKGLEPIFDFIDTAGDK